MYCGLRKGEILGLRSNDFDLKKNIVKVRNVVTFDKSTPLFKEMPKTDSSIRNIPLPAILSDFIKYYIDNLKGLFLFEKERGIGLMTQTSYNRFMESIIKKLNIAAGGNNQLSLINGLTAHVFRHHYATTLYYAGVKVKDAQYLLGHSKVELTLNIYTHNSNGETIESLNKYLALNA